MTNLSEDRLIRLYLFEIPVLISVLALFINSDMSEIRYTLRQELDLRSSPEFTHSYLQDPANFWVWMNFESPKLKYIQAGTDSIGGHVKIAYESNYGKELLFISRLLSRAVLVPNGDMQAMFQVKYLLENEFFDITIDHNMVDSYYQLVGCGIVTYVRIKVKSKILGSSLILGWSSLAEILKEGHDKLMADIEKQFELKKGVYEEDKGPSIVEVKNQSQLEIGRAHV